MDADVCQAAAHVLRHHKWVHHLTADELTLALSGITATATIVVAIAVSRASRRGEHISRVWERRTEVYEFVLCQADRSREMRTEAVWNAVRDDVAILTPPEPVAEGAEWRKSWVRLQMYGERGVREAFERYGEADKQFIMAFIGWRKAAELNVKADRGDVPAHLAIEGTELVRLQKAMEAANDSANAQQEKLVAVVAKNIGRIPRYERRAWQRLKRSQTD